MPMDQYPMFDAHARGDTVIDTERFVLRFRVTTSGPPLSPFLGAVNSAPWRGRPEGTWRLISLVPSRLLRDVIYAEVEYRAGGWPDAAYPADFNQVDLGHLVAEVQDGRAA